MSNPEDHALGLELQLIELVERQQRARAQHRDPDAEAVQAEIDALLAELATVVERTMSRPAGWAEVHEARASEPGSLSAGG